MKRILLMEDDQAFLHTLTDALDILNYQVEVLNDPEGLFGKLCDFRPDLLLVDFTLNKGNGGKICKQVKGNPEFSCISVLIMSGYEDVTELAKQAGADDFIKKPFDISELDDKIEKCISRKRRSQFRNFT